LFFCFHGWYLQGFIYWQKKFPHFSLSFCRDARECHVLCPASNDSWEGFFLKKKKIILPPYQFTWCFRHICKKLRKICIDCFALPFN
jgi:hypothetical protein